MIRLAESNMINALKLVTVQRGHDPRDLTLVASGGGGPMHAAELGRELGVRRVIIPRFAGLFSAWGMLGGAATAGSAADGLSAGWALTRQPVQTIFDDLGVEAGSDMTPRTVTQCGSRAQSTCAMSGRSIACRWGSIRAYVTVDGLLAAFHAAHRRAYTFDLPDTPAELVTFHLAVEQEAPRIGLPLLRTGGSVADAQRGSRRVLFAGADGERLTPAFQRDLLPAGAMLPGPCLIEEPTSTTLVLPGQSLHVEQHGLLVIEETR